MSERNSAMKNYQLEEIGQRLATLRDFCDLTPEEMAEKLGISVEEYVSYENGEADFSFSFIMNAAAILDVDVVDILSGVSPKLSTCTVVRKGKGFSVNRYEKYDYKHLAHTFRGAVATPLHVTVKPDDEPPVMHEHPGQEFDYVLRGTMKFYLGDISYELNKGDSVYFDSSLPHAEKAIGDKDLEFLAIVLGPQDK